MLAHPPSHQQQLKCHLQRPEVIRGTTRPTVNAPEGQAKGRVEAHGRAGLAALAGRDLGTTEWRVIEQDAIDRFADVSGDRQWIHVDRVRSAVGPYGTTIAHGLLTLSWGVHMLQELLVVTGYGRSLNYGFDRVRYPTPVPAGGQVRLHAAVTSVEPVDNDGLHITRDLTFELAGERKPACVARALTRFYDLV